jgi:signal transduction histidine kinase
MIDHTLEVSRFQAGQLDLRLESIPLREFWPELQGRCSDLPRKPEVTLEWSRPVPNAVLRSDRRKLVVILRNLISNALKFTEQGSVRVGLKLTADALVFEVADTGIGFRPEDRDAIFEMFRQLDGSSTRRYGGVGLGLYIVRRFADQIGAVIEVESELSSGSVFRVRFAGEACVLHAA